MALNLGLPGNPEAPARLPRHDESVSLWLHHGTTVGTARYGHDVGLL